MAQTLAKDRALLGARATERRMHRLWREEGPRLPPLTCDDGTLLRVVYAGRPSAAAGPDFRDAILSTQDGRLLRGDVELHLTPGGWRAHGHHRDRLYNGVVLNVVLWPASMGRGQTRLEMGARVPTVALFPVLEQRQLEQGSRGLAPALPLLPGAPDRVAVLLDRAGDARFRKKVCLFAGLLSAHRPSGPRSPGQARTAGAEELLYQRLMEALGYTRNREPFLALAQGVPLALLARAAMGASGEERARTLLALLLGGGGFLADAPADAGGASLRHSWRATGLAPVVSRGGWHLFRVRPDNHPRRRLEGMALLLARNWDPGLLPALALRVREGTVDQVRDALTVGGAGPPGQPGAAPPRRTAYIGHGRAGEMAVNVLLPLCAAWAAVTGDTPLRRAALALYRAWPALPHNEITREMTDRLLGQEDPQPLRSVTARRQQGMIHLYRRRVSHEGPPA